MAERIFLDTQVFESVSFNFKTTTLASLREQVQQDRAVVVLTDITVREVKARISFRVQEQLKALTKIVKDARVVRSSTLANVTAALNIDEQAVVDDICQQFDEFLTAVNAEVLNTSQLVAGPILDKYFSGTPPFAKTENKKSEFPDAFTVEALAANAHGTNTPIHVVSGDDLFRDACANDPLLPAATTLSSVLDKIVAVHQVVDFLKEQVTAHQKDIADKAKESFEDLSYNLEDEWGEATMEIKVMDFLGDPEVIEQEDGSATLEVRFAVVFDAHLSYEDSDTGVYDSELRSRLFMERVEETIEQNEEFVVEVEVSFSEDLAPGNFAIEEVRLVQPDDAYLVATSKTRGWPYK